MCTAGSQPPLPGTTQAADTTNETERTDQRPNNNETATTRVTPIATAPVTIAPTDSEEAELSSSIIANKTTDPTSIGATQENIDQPSDTLRENDSSALTPPTSDEDTAEDVLNREDEYSPPHGTHNNKASANPRVTRSAARASRCTQSPPPPSKAVTNSHMLISPAPIQPRRTKRSLAAFQLGHKSPSPIRKKRTTPPHSLRDQTPATTTGSSTTSGTTMTAPKAKSRDVPNRATRASSSRAAPATRTPQKITNTRSPRRKGLVASPRTTQNNVNAKNSFDRIRSILPCPQDNCNAVGMWHVKGALDILCKQCNLRVTKQRFVTLVESHALSDGTNSDGNNDRSIRQLRADTHKQVLPNQNDLQKKVEEQAEKLTQLLDIQIQQQQKIACLEKTITDQQRQITNLRSMHQNKEDTDVAMEISQSPTCDDNPEGCTVADTENLEEPNRPRTPSRRQDDEGTTDCTLQRLPRRNREENSPKTTRACSPHSVLKQAERTRKPSFKDVVSRETAAHARNNATTDTAANPGHKHSKRNIPWASMPETTQLDQLPLRQREAIIRARKSLAPLSQRTIRNNTAPSAIYFHGVRRGPYKTVYKTLNRLIDRKNLLGISFIGADIIELLVNTKEVPSILQKMRFMQWTHLPRFDPTKHDNVEAEKTKLDQKERVTAAYTRWYNAWTHAKHKIAQLWYAQQGQKLYNSNPELFADQPEKRTFSTFQTQKERGATSEPGTATQNEGGCADKWKLIHVRSPPKLPSNAAPKTT